MRLVMIDEGRRGIPGAVLPSGEILHLHRAARPGSIEAWLPDSLVGILQAGEAGLSAVRAMVARFEVADATITEHARAQGLLMPATTALLAPLPSPGLIVAAGLAFKSHLAEMAGTPAPPHPTAFMKSSRSVTGPGQVYLPRQASQMVDYEGELAIVFGRTCHLVQAADALDYVAGFSAANDLSARDWVEDVWKATQPWQARLTWEVNIMGKQLPGFTVLGPALLTIDEVADPGSLRLRTILNGEVVQDARIDDLIFPIAEMIAWFSRWYTFEPGDVLLSGTPAGVGVGRTPRLFLKPDDRIEVEVTGVGTLSNQIVAHPDL